MTAILQAAPTPSRSVSLRLLGFSTGDMLQQALTSAFSELGYEARLTSAGFGTVVTELLEPPLDLPDVIAIQVDPAGLIKRDWRLTTEDGERLFSQSIEMFLGALEEFSRKHSVQVLINSLPSPVSPSAGYLDPFHPDGAGYLVEVFNRRLGECVRTCSNVTIIDTDLAMAHIAPAKRSDPKLWFYGRVPYSMEATRALAVAFAEAYLARKSKPVKALALDLDNTLWRGIYGEDGLQGIECGDDFPGNAFRAFQNECLRLKSQGLLLTVLSKNDEDVLEVFDAHPGMALRREDIVAHRINWEPKAQNIRALADELGVGLDSFLFLDDSPHEREAMRRLAPEVRVPELPEDPALRIDFLRNHQPLWPLRLTAEDRSRSELYVVQSKGRALKSQVASINEYLAGLGQRLSVEPMRPETLPRVAQMHARTNQFNLTTLRLTEAELSSQMADEDGHTVLLGRLRDQFGDHGIVICASVRRTGSHAEIVTFLMSCRVIGRQVEFAFLDALLTHLVANGVEHVTASCLPTQKNTPARDFFEKAGFDLERRTDTDLGPETHWHWRKDTHRQPGSDYMTVEGIG